MILKLNKIKIFDELSQETTCFTASLSINGEIFANIRNDGNGGSNVYEYQRNFLQSEEALHRFALNFSWDFDFEQVDQLIDFMLKSWHFENCLSPCEEIFLCRAIAPGSNDGSQAYPLAYTHLGQIEPKAIALIPVAPTPSTITLLGNDQIILIEAKQVFTPEGVFIESSLSGNLETLVF